MTETSKIKHAKANNTIHLVSFGYKHASIPKASIILSARHLPNPYWDSDLKMLTGLDQPIIDYLRQSDEMTNFIKSTFDLITHAIELNKDNTPLNIAIGCTGGQHRSVYMVEQLSDTLTKAGYTVTSQHIHQHLWETHDDEHT